MERPVTDYETAYRALRDGLEAEIRAAFAAGFDLGGDYPLMSRRTYKERADAWVAGRALLASSPAEGTGDWFRRTPESLAMLEVERKALAESEDAYAASRPAPVSSGEAAVAKVARVEALLAQWTSGRGPVGAAALRNALLGPEDHDDPENRYDPDGVTSPILRPAPVVTPSTEGGE